MLKDDYDINIIGRQAWEEDQRGDYPEHHRGLHLPGGHPVYRL